MECDEFNIGLALSCNESYPQYDELMRSTKEVNNRKHFQVAREMRDCACNLMVVFLSSNLPTYGMGNDVQRWNIMGIDEAMDVFYVASILLVDVGILAFVETMTQVAKLLKEHWE